MIELGHIPAGNYVESNQAVYWDEEARTYLCQCELDLSIQNESIRQEIHHQFLKV